MYIFNYSNNFLNKKIIFLIEKEPQKGHKGHLMVVVFVYLIRSSSLKIDHKGECLTVNSQNVANTQLYFT